jgi:hypothetical protein
MNRVRPAYLEVLKRSNGLMMSSGANSEAFRPEGGESTSDVRERVVTFLKVPPHF